MAWTLIDHLDMKMLGEGVPDATRAAFKARFAVRPVCPVCFVNPALAQREQPLAKVALGNSYYYHCPKCFSRLDPL
ncbi:MAG: hypothetical protein JWN73_4331 [Betaproteobacteria bacterium]|nr:hypothetical protein [Betaproteobacteria bacterium]